MTIYLYVKTHNKTGLKYLGKTKALDPFKYPGSGTRWQHHLKVHGKDISTTILKECNTKEEVAYWGLYYSELWDVVNSPSWANLIPENGGETTVRTPSEEHRAKMSAALKGKNKGKRAWNKGKQMGPSPLIGRKLPTRSLEHSAKISASCKVANKKTPISEGVEPFSRSELV